MVSYVQFSIRRYKSMPLGMQLESIAALQPSFYFCDGLVLFH